MMPKCCPNDAQMIGNYAPAAPAPPLSRCAVLLPAGYCLILHRHVEGDGDVAQLVEGILIQGGRGGGTWFISLGPYPRTNA